MAGTFDLGCICGISKKRVRFLRRWLQKQYVKEARIKTMLVAILMADFAEHEKIYLGIKLGDTIAENRLQGRVVNEEFVVSPQAS